MPIKAILVPLGQGGNDATLLDAAFTVARRFDAHVEALYVQRNPPDWENLLVSDSWCISDEMKRSVSDAAARGAKAAASEARKTFKDYCRPRQVALIDAPPAPAGLSASWRSLLGEESVVVVHLGRLADLIVVSRPVEEAPPPRTLEAALMETHRPLLIVPPEGLPSSCGSRIAIGWNGSAEAAAAIATAMPFLATADQVVVLTTDNGTVGTPAADLARYLAWHGITGDVHEFDAGAQSTGKALLREAEALGSDLLVLGGYGHSRTRELILGGVTRDVLAASEIPVLMTH